MSWSLVCAAVGIYGMLLAGKKNLWGWAVGVASELLWMVYGIATMQWGVSIAALAYGLAGAKNFVEWRRETTCQGSCTYETTEGLQ